MRRRLIKMPVHKEKTPEEIHAEEKKAFITIIVVMVLVILLFFFMLFLRKFV